MTKPTGAVSSASECRSFSLVPRDLRPFLESFEPLPATLDSLDDIRNWPNEPVLPPPAPAVTERVIEGPADHPGIRILIIDPNPGAKCRPALLHMHGGGYIMGSPEIIAPQLQITAQKVGCVIVSVAYRLAPETPYPGALEDNYAALKWLHRNASELGVDSLRISVGGESAGGGHAAALAIAARERNGPPISYQHLVYPMLDDRTGISKSVSPEVGEFIWTVEHNRLGWSALLGVPAGSESVPEGSVPARVENLEGLPTTFIAVGSLDLFLSENLEYARRLTDAGVSVVTHVEPGAYHGSNKLVPEARSSQRFNQRLLEELRKNL